MQDQPTLGDGVEACLANCLYQNQRLRIEPGCGSGGDVKTLKRIHGVRAKRSMATSLCRAVQFQACSIRYVSMVNRWLTGFSPFGALPIRPDISAAALSPRERGAKIVDREILRMFHSEVEDKLTALER